MRRTFVVVAAGVLAGCAAWTLGSLESTGVERSFPPPAPTLAPELSRAIDQSLDAYCTTPVGLAPITCSSTPRPGYHDPMDALHERQWERDNDPYATQ